MKSLLQLSRKRMCMSLTLMVLIIHRSHRELHRRRRCNCHHLEGMTIGDIMVRGRWAANKSAVHYIQQGRQLLMLHEIPSLVDRFGREFGCSLVPLLSALSQFTM